MTTRVVQEILKNIEKNESIEMIISCIKILESNREIKNAVNKQNDEKIKKQNSVGGEENKSLGIEKDKNMEFKIFLALKMNLG